MHTNKTSYIADTSSISDYLSLLKPGVMSLIVFSALTGIVVAPGDKNLFIVFVTILANALGSGAAAAINMWYDADIDRIMERTKKRAIPRGAIPAAEALAFGVVLAVISVLLMLLATNILAAFLLLVAINFYVFIYTIWLKRSTPQNIVIGGAAGAFPPMIGYAAITGDISALSLLLFAIIFFWTPPHFWALALFRNDDYKKANVPMLPVTDGIEATCKQIVFYTLILIVSSFAVLAFADFTSWIYISSAALLNAKFLQLAIKLSRETNKENSMRLFGFSISYLFILFAALMLDYVF